ncbi:MAG: hypothetical protein RL398_1529 [Planctomycetota bacterium]
MDQGMVSRIRQTPISRGARVALAAMLTAVMATAQAAPAAEVPGDNPYRLTPFHADFPVQLQYPNRYGLEYDRTRRQVLERLVANLQGNVRREAWQMAMEFFWRAPEDAVDPLVEGMDRWFGHPVADVVRNCVEAMGKMRDERLDAALRRALEHPNEQVRQAALAALGRSGARATVLELGRFFGRMDGRSRASWLQAVRDRLGEERVGILRDLMNADYPSVVRDQVLEVALTLPAAEMAEVLRGRWNEALGEFKAIIAVALHQVGDTSGTAWLKDALEGQDLARLQMALKHLGRVELGVLRTATLLHSTHLRADVRLEVAKCLRFRDGDDIADVYEVLASPDEALDTREIALRELTRRGRSSAVTALLEEATTATGTRLQVLLHLLAVSGDDRGVQLLVERFERAPETERRPFLQALAQNNSAAAATALLDIFRGPPRIVGRGVDAAYTTIGYLSTLLLNLRGHEAAILEAYRGLPKDDHVRRASLLTTLAGLAADRTDETLRATCLEEVRRVLFDREECPQLRVLALNLLTPRALTVEDALKLKRQRFDEQPGLRALFADFLNEYF